MASSKKLTEMLINELITDRYFDIYTRNGLEYILRRTNTDNDLVVFLLDFNNLKGLNNRLGYKKVNELFKEVLSIFKDEFIIGRAFSGDEIFLCTENINIDINDIKKICLEYNLEFTSIWGLYHPHYGKLSTFLDGLIEQLHQNDSNIINNLLKNSRFQLN